MKALVIAAVFALCSGGAMAHSPLKTSTPADGAVIVVAPSELALDFTGGIRLTRVTVAREGRDGVDLDLEGHEGFVSDYVIPMQGKGSGAYVIEWRGLGDDGHAMSGTVRFTVAP